MTYSIAPHTYTHMVMTRANIWRLDGLKAMTYIVKTDELLCRILYCVSIMKSTSFIPGGEGFNSWLNDTKTATVCRVV